MQSADGYGDYPIGLSSWDDSNGSAGCTDLGLPNNCYTLYGNNPDPVEIGSSTDYYDVSATCSGWQCDCFDYYISGEPMCRVAEQDSPYPLCYHGAPGLGGLDTCAPFIENNLGYGLAANLPSISSMTFSSSSTLQIAAEDSIIDDIQHTGHIHVKIDTPAIGDSYTATIPATNCYKISGNGPNAVVFMRGQSASTTLASYLSMVNGVISNGFDSVDPFKTYINQFSFYVDLNDHNDGSFPTTIVDYPPNTSHFTDDVSEQLKVKNPCNGSVIDWIDQNGNPQSPQSVTDIFYFHLPNLYPAWTTGWGSHFSFLDTVQNDSRSNPQDTLSGSTLHEFGHAFGSLLDEYQIGDDGDIPDNTDINLPNSAANCTLIPDRDFSGGISGGNLIYASRPGGYWVSSCSYLTSISNPESSYYAPSTNSLMDNDLTLTGRYNIIDCGYLVAAIDGEGVSLNNAQIHWPLVDEDDHSKPGCSAMDTVKSDVPALGSITPPPVITGHSASIVVPGQHLAISAGISNDIPFPEKGDIFEKVSYYLNKFAKSAVAAAIGSSASVSGSGFTPTGNAVVIYNAATSSEIYDISSDGTTLNFTIPSNLPAGLYSLKVGAFNSNWSNSMPITITAPFTTSCRASPNTAILGQNIVWTATTTSGGVAPYTYSWSGASAQTPVVQTSYTGIGTKTQTLTVTDSRGVSVDATCSVVISAPSNFFVTLTSPNGGEQYRQGQTKLISWTTNIPSQQSNGFNIVLYYGGNSTDVGSYGTAVTIANGVMGSSYFWTIPGSMPIGNYVAYITFNNQPLVRNGYDFSDNYFTINSSSSVPNSIPVVVPTPVPQTESAELPDTATTAPAITSFTVTPTPAVRSQPLALSWTTTGISSCTIDSISNTYLQSIFGSLMGVVKGSADSETVTIPSSIGLRNVGTSGTVELGCYSGPNLTGTYIYQTVPVVVPSQASPTSTPYTITSSITGPGTITCIGKVCPSSVTAGTRETFTATPDTGYAFTGWSGSCSGTIATCTLTINSNTSVSATFTVAAPVTSPTITVTSPNGGEQYTPGQTVPISWTTNLTSHQYDGINIVLYYGGNSTDVGSFSTAIPVVSEYSGGSPYNWTIPTSLSGGNYAVYITPNQPSVQNNGLFDFSDNYFTVVSGTTTSFQTNSMNITAAIGNAIQQYFSSWLKM